MRIGLAYDLKPQKTAPGGMLDEEAEEYDPPKTIDALAAEIERLGHQVVRLGGGVAFLDNVRSAHVDFVFNISEGRGTYRGREAQIPSVLEMLGIPYSGSDPLSLSICLDKPSAKLVALSAGVRTPPYKVVRSLDELHDLQCGLPAFPLVVKPAFEGSSKGIHYSSRVETCDDLQRSVEAVLTAYRQPALLEQFIPGTEITVGIVGNTPPRIVGVMEVVPRSGDAGNFMYTIEVKRNWRDLVFYRCPPDLPRECIQDIEDAALTMYKALDCRDMGRIDFRIDSQHRGFFLEANPLPGLGDYSDLPIMAGMGGWSFSQLIEAILNPALERYGLLGPSYAHSNSI